MYVYLKICSIPNIKKQEVLNSFARSAITAPQTFNNVGLPLAILYDYHHLFQRVSAVKGKGNIIKKIECIHSDTCGVCYMTWIKKNTMI